MDDPPTTTTTTQHHHMPAQHHAHHQLAKDLSHLHLQQPSAHHRSNNAGPQSNVTSSSTSSSSSAHHAKLLQQQQQQSTSSQQHQQQQQQQQQQLQHSPSWYSGSGNGGTLRSTGSGRRASYGHNHYQQPLTLPSSAVNYHDMADTVSIGSGHSAQRYSTELHSTSALDHRQQSHHHHQRSSMSPAMGAAGDSRSVSVGSGTGSMAVGGLGSAGSMLIDRSGSTDRFGALEDPLSTSCLQPPSPAPSNDHYSVMGLPAPAPTSGGGSHHYSSDRHYGTIQRRTASPSNIRYRHSLTESYRDMSPQCDRYIPPPAHFLAGASSALAAADTYGYLGANVHTPIKRYVPTPPPQEPTYQPLPGTASSSAKTQALMSALLGQGVSLGSGSGSSSTSQRNIAPAHHAAQYAYATSTLPYGFRVKTNNNAIGSEHTISPPKGFETPDHYNGASGSGSNNGVTGSNTAAASNNGNHNAPPARVRPPKCPVSSLVAVPNATSTLPHPTSSHGTRSNSGGRYSQPTMAPPSSITSSISSCSGSGTSSSIYRMSRTSSAEFLDQPRGLYRVSTPVSVMSEPNGTSGSASCLHCNTLRRTTGVHQTTQTTGPISPQPLNHPQELPNGSCHSVPISPASLTSPQQTNGMLSLVQSSMHGHSGSQQQHSVSSPYLQHPQHQLHHSQSHMIQSSTGKTALAVGSSATAAAAAAQSSHSQTYDNLHDRSQLDGRDIATIPRNGSKHQFVQSGPGSGGIRTGTTEAPSMESIISASSSSRSMLIPQQQYSNTSIPSQSAPPNVQQQQQQQQLPPQPTTTTTNNPASTIAQQSQQTTAQQQSVPPLQLIANGNHNSSSSSPQQQQQQHSQLTLEAQHASSTASIAQQQQQHQQPSPQPTLAPSVPVSLAQSTIASPAIVPYVPAAPPPLVAAPHHSLPHLQHGPASLNDSPASTLQRSSNAQLLRIPQSNLSCKQRLKEYVRRETAKFFGVLPGQQDEEYERSKWDDRQRRFACRRFGTLRDEHDEPGAGGGNGGQRGAGGHDGAGGIGAGAVGGGVNGHGVGPLAPSDRPDILPAQSQDERETELSRRQRANPHFGSHDQHHHQAADGSDVYLIRAERKPSVPAVIYGGLSFLVQSITRHRLRTHKQWSRSFAPAHVELTGSDGSDGHCDGLAPIPDGEAFFDTPTAPTGAIAAGSGAGAAVGGGAAHDNNSRQLYVSDGDRTTGSSGIINGWRTKSAELHQQQQQHNQQQDPANGVYGQRISSNILDGVLDNSVRPVRNRVKLLRPNLLDERYDYRPFFTYWINTVQIVVMVLSLICYGFGPIGIGMEYRSAQVLVTSLSLQQVHHQEPRNIWIGLRSADLIHLGAKYGACMRRDAKIMDVVSRTRKHERETACCIRNDDSGCVQSSQADCSIRGWPSKTIATWKKWSPGESGPGGRISGSVCGLDPKYCDAPASIAPHEWPDDITKWPICRKNNQLSQRFRFKDHTAEHMVCEVIGHPCCIGVYGECRITTREYCDFVNGYFHEEASLCSQVSCLNDVCGMFHFMAIDYPDQFYRLFTSLCLHAGLLHLLVSVAFQHVLLADLERLIGPLRTAILYIGSGIAGNLTSAIFVPYKAEVGPLPSIAGVLASLMLQLVLCHWKSLKKPHIAMIKLLILGCTLFGLGTLPLQQNFTGLIAGLLTGITLTLAFVPFVNVRKHSRKSKINLIWTCVTLQFVLYATMFIIFYAFPTLFESLNFIDGNQLMDPNAGHGYHDHYSLYDGYNNYNPLGPSSGSGHNSAGGHGHGNAGGPVGGGGASGSGNNGKIGTYNNNNQNIYKTSGGNVMHNHHDYTGGGGGGNGISMSGGGSSSGGRNGGSAGRPAIGNNLLKTISLCEKGQCVSLRQPRQHADTNA